MKYNTIAFLLLTTLLSSCEKDKEITPADSSESIIHRIAFEQLVYSEPEHQLIEKNSYNQFGVLFRTTYYSLLVDTLIVSNMCEYELEDNYVIRNKNYFYNIGEPKYSEGYENVFNELGQLVACNSQKHHMHSTLFKYDDNNKLIQHIRIQSPTTNDYNITFDFQYNSDGLVDSIILSNIDGVIWERIHYSYNNNKQVVSCNCFHEDNTPYYAYEYKYTPDGTIISETFYNSDFTKTREKLYDELGRLSAFKRNGEIEVSYEYTGNYQAPINAITPITFYLSYNGLPLKF